MNGYQEKVIIYKGAEAVEDWVHKLQHTAKKVGVQNQDSITSAPNIGCANAHPEH